MADATGGGPARAVLVFDLDGTLYRGSAQAERYGRELERAVAREKASAFRREVDAYLAGETLAPGYDDWDSLARIARRFEADPGGMQQAFLRTRSFMLSGRCALEVPAGLSEFLEEVRGRVFRLAVSNSPASSVDPLLTKLGLLSCLDRTEASAHKPQGFIMRVEGALREAGLLGAPVLSIGDHLRNDIEPAREAGWDTAYIRSRPDFPAGASTYEGPSVEALLPDLRAWVLTRAGPPGGEAEARSGR